MSWLDDILSREAWSESPGTTAAKAGACLVAPWACLAGEVAERGREAGAAARARVDEVVDGVSGEGGLLDELGELAGQAGEAAARPVEAVASVVKWYAFALYAVAIVVVALVVWWFFK